MSEYRCAKRPPRGKYDSGTRRLKANDTPPRPITVDSRQKDQGVKCSNPKFRRVGKGGSGMPLVHVIKLVNILLMDS